MPSLLSPHLSSRSLDQRVLPHPSVRAQRQSQKPHKKGSGLWLGALAIWVTSGSLVPAIALPPPEDIPEEVLRTEIITEARSPIDGEKLTAAEYAELEEQLQAREWTPNMDPRVRHLIFLLQIRRTIRTFTPFL